MNLNMRKRIEGTPEQLRAMEISIMAMQILKQKRAKQ